LVAQCATWKSSSRRAELSDQIGCFSGAINHQDSPPSPLLLISNLMASGHANPRRQIALPSNLRRPLAPTFDSRVAFAALVVSASVMSVAVPAFWSSLGSYTVQLSKLKPSRTIVCPTWSRVGPAQAAPQRPEIDCNRDGIVLLFLGT
jgi:hypothetical protein